MGGFFLCCISQEPVPRAKGHTPACGITNEREPLSAVTGHEGLMWQALIYAMPIRTHTTTWKE